MTPAELIAALEVAPGPSRELDAMLHEADAVFPNWRKWLFADGSISVLIPPYTASLDAAMTLVPKEWDWTLYSDGSGEIYKDVPSGMLPGALGSTSIDFEGATPALALCIAVLRAMELKL